MVWAFSNFVENLRTTISKRISIMVKNKVVLLIMRINIIGEEKQI